MTAATSPALALLDLSSIAAGIAAADAMVKRAPIAVLKSGTVQPGRYLVLVGGEVADVQESLAAGVEAAGTTLLGRVYLPNVHPQVLVALAGERRPTACDALGIVETATVAAAIHAADAGLKGAAVELVELRLADGLGGKGLVLFSGVVADVEAAVEIGVGVLSEPAQLVRREVIPQLHAAVWDDLAPSTRFAGLPTEGST